MNNQVELEAKMQQNLEEGSITTVNLSVPFESLVKAIQSLSVEAQKKLLEILEDQIFEAEEEWENSPEILAEVEEARQAYQAGDYQTIEKFMSNQS